MNDALYMGYYCHLIADEFWIQEVFIKYMRDENRKKRVDRLEAYYSDFDILNRLLREKFAIKKDIVSKDGTIDEVEMSKVPQLLQALDRDFKVEFSDKKLSLFTYSDIEKYIYRTSSLLVDDLKRICCK